ncbi:hypothetical protein KAFR_0C01560 [Kazachstania africana CBS 2517]|uniref:Cyclin-like domain-containing protein n=1 Tax=Kazachstania africana (strain ATCC 22294 / BCRC 22015 / CBS 2517 / CECT 1963 / NBRC 1671 / NRRL Y-8276) TaxID=1071382 RepID=H2ARZ9_KAZAF|nr:hypothetical protein KAFR_0C01560 [Kazachstania africana CBS 2517]CCF57149.1 hypothetical protein KAFR_0C01560 [Kazachstania africana CBS 2517]
MESYSKALNILMKSPVTDEMIQYLTRTTLQVLPYGNNQSYPSPPGSPSASLSKQPRLPSLRTFITRLVRYTNVYTPTLLTTVCYLNKLKRILPKDAKGLPSTIHRLFLACLIISAKFHNDSSPLNKHWTRYTDGLFSLEDINLMERQLLQLLNWNLRVTNEDLILDLQVLLEPIREHIEITKIQKKKLQQYKKQARQIKYNKCYDHQRSVSTLSNLSSTSTLVNNSYNSLSEMKSAMNGPSLHSHPIDIWHDSNISSYGWNLEQVAI